jgi:acyl-CoA synthetase (NDP forming)
VRVTAFRAGLRHRSTAQHQARQPRPQPERSGSLSNTGADGSEAYDVAERRPDRVEELKALWLEEAKSNTVLSLNDMNAHRGDGTRLT